MSLKNVYFFKTTIMDTQTRQEVDINQLKPLLDQILDQNMQNNAILLSRNDVEPVVIDILERNDDFLFARLGKKRLSNSVQRRNYNTLMPSPVLSPREIDDNGIELFTYCILGYRHGILSIAHSKGAPNENAFNRLFGYYMNQYQLDIESVPNSDLINEIYNGNSPEINRIAISIPVPDARLLGQVFNMQDQGILHAIQANTNTVVFEVKPELRGSLSGDRNIIRRIIDELRNSRQRFSKVIIDAKSETNQRRTSYDLYEEYFKYPIDVLEYHTENGRKIEYPKEDVQADYKLKIARLYNEYKPLILAVCDRDDE